MTTQSGRIGVKVNRANALEEIARKMPEPKNSQPSEPEDSTK